VQPFGLVKIVKGNRVAQVLAIDASDPRLPPMVQYRIIRPRLSEGDGFNSPTKGRTGAPERVSAGHIGAAWAKYVEDPRSYFMGPTPSKNGPIGRAVIVRMRGEGKIVGEKVKYGRDRNGNPLPNGQFELYSLNECAMGHVIDAVTWWNTNGRFAGPQSLEVQKFMADPGNYEIEPSGPNSLRGALLGGRGARYLPSAK
jgi:hypothetical protein